ncbi:MAG TPA: alpha/beta hydrolase [Intrasporangium sp.]|nr:alpha/beta hydrolase [Intrasporangium sp.]
MSPIRPREVTLHGHKLSYVDSGSGEAILFVHGLLGSHRNWRHLVDRLDNTNRVIVPDLFGHGASEKHEADYSPSAQAATLRDLINRLDIDRVTIVGHSLGGGISLAFCYLFPDRVERLVLVGTGGLGREVSPALRAATLPVADWVLPVIASPWVRGGAELVGRGLSLFGWRASHDIRAAWEGFTELSDADARRAFLATTRAVMNSHGQTIAAHEYLLELAELPVLVVWGTNDMVIPVDHAKRLGELAPACRVEIFDGAGHFPHLDQPDRFADVLRDFISTTARADDAQAGSATATPSRARPRRRAVRKGATPGRTARQDRTA